MRREIQPLEALVRALQGRTCTEGRRAPGSELKMYAHLFLKIMKRALEMADTTNDSSTAAMADTSALRA